MRCACVVWDESVIALNDLLMPVSGVPCPGVLCSLMILRCWLCNCVKLSVRGLEYLLAHLYA